MQSRTSGDVLKRQESFNTEMGMAFSAENDIDDYQSHVQAHNSRTALEDGTDEEDEEHLSTANLSAGVVGKSNGKAVELVLETERGIKAQEQDFLK